MVVAALMAVLTFSNSDQGSAGSTAAVPFGWTIPLLAAVVLGAVAWTLSVQPRQQESGEEPHLRARPCSACGKTVMGEWRLCPYCGRMLDAMPGVPVDVTPDLS